MSVDPIRGPGFIVPAAHMPTRVNEADADRRRQHEEEEKEETPEQQSDTLELHKTEPEVAASTPNPATILEGPLDLEC